MGQQQLLLIILGVIVVGIAVAVGITMFADNAISANRDALTNDLVNLGSRAQQFYRRPTSLGGGGNSFALLDNITRLTNKPGNANGSYWFVSNGAAGSVGPVIGGVGTETGNDGTGKVEVHLQVWADRDSMWVVN